MKIVITCSPVRDIIDIIHRSVAQMLFKVRPNEWGEVLPFFFFFFFSFKKRRTGNYVFGLLKKTPPGAPALERDN